MSATDVRWEDEGAYPWPVGVMKYSSTCTRSSRNRGLRLIRDSSARMPSYCRSR
jgi:hypothetical protein